MRLKAVQLLVNSRLPEELRNYERRLDAGGVNDLFTEVARSHPNRYAEILKSLGDIGRNASWRQGETLTLADLKPVMDRDAVLKEMDQLVSEARANAVDDADFEEQRNNIWTQFSDKLEKATAREALAKGNNLAYAVLSGARGKNPQLKAMLTTPGVYQDAKGKLIPMFVRRSFGEGLRPAEYLASTYGTRTSVLSTKRATAKGGYFSKLLQQAAAPIIVTERDCGVANGVDLPIDDTSLRNRVLVRETAGYPAGTVIDRDVLNRLRRSKDDHVLVRSAMTCQAKQGVCSRCLGAQADGKMPAIGSSVGITGAQAIGEPITQGALNTKHVGGQASAKKEYSGFDVINRFAQSPEIFEDRAVVTEKDGVVERIEEAPQGGSYVVVSGEKHYIAPGYPIIAKPGQKVEAGDPLAEGLIDPGDMVRLRGIGEARNYYATRFKKILDDSGMLADRRNTEMMARAAIDHVLITDDEGPAGTLPDDIVSYSRVASNYEPPQDTVTDSPDKLHDKFLQVPALHYSIGTRITPRVSAHLISRGFGQVHASPTKPPFEPEMVRLQSAAHNNPDWLAGQHTSYLKKQLSDHAVRGSDTNIRENTHFVPRLAIGSGFGENVGVTGKF